MMEFKFLYLMKKHNFVQIKIMQKVFLLYLIQLKKRCLQK